MNESFKIKPTGIGGQILLFGGSSLLFWIGIYWSLPYLTSSGMSIGPALTISLVIPLFLLFVGAVVFGFRESTNGLKGLFNRWQLKPMKKKDWAWMVFLWAVYAASLSLNGISSSINNSFLNIQPPVAFGQIMTQTKFWGMTMSGNWWVLVAYFGILLVNVFGEDLWFSGILFPKQKQKFGKYTWLIFGLSYYLFHMFYPWDILRLLPCSLAYGWVMQKTENTWVTLLAHFLFNGMALVAAIPSIMN